MLVALRLAADDAPVERRNFVSCPIVRDTPSVPCWLAEYDGELYFLTLQTDVSAPVTPPWLGHRVLVEGTVARDRPRICGGVVLEPVVLSVLPELDASCNTPVLPAEERYNLTFEPPRPPGPSAGRLAFAGAPRPPAARRAAARVRAALRLRRPRRVSPCRRAHGDFRRSACAHREPHRDHRLSRHRAALERHDADGAGVAGAPPRRAGRDVIARRRPDRRRLRRRMARRAGHRRRARTTPRCGASR